MSLKVGRPVNDTLYAAILYQANLATAIDVALRYLRFRPRTVHEVQRHLAAKQVPSGLIQPVVDHLMGLELLGDKTYASAFHEAKRETWSRAQIQWKLRQRGVSPEVARSVVDVEHAREQEYETALRLAEKRWRLLQQRPSTSQHGGTSRQKLAAYLQRRGFPATVVRQVVRNIAQETQSNHEPGFPDEVSVAWDEEMDVED